MLGFVVEINFVKIQYKCDVCKQDIQNEHVCRSGCFIKNPQINVQVLCVLQDGTMKASLELKNERCLQAFNVSEKDIRMFKDYCLRYGMFQHPSQTFNTQFKEVLNVFKKFESWT